LKLNGIDPAHEGLDLLQILGGLLEIADTGGIFADIGFRPADDSATEILNSVALVMMEDGHIHLFAPTKRIIQLHVFGREPVFMDQGTNNPLSH